MVVPSCASVFRTAGRPGLFGSDRFQTRCCTSSSVPCSPGSESVTGTATGSLATSGLSRSSVDSGPGQQLAHLGSDSRELVATEEDASFGRRRLAVGHDDDRAGGSRDPDRRWLLLVPPRSVGARFAGGGNRRQEQRGDPGGGPRRSSTPSSTNFGRSHAPLPRDRLRRVRKSRERHRRGRRVRHDAGPGLEDRSSTSRRPGASRSTASRSTSPPATSRSTRTAPGGRRVRRPGADQPPAGLHRAGAAAAVDDGVRNPITLDRLVNAGLATVTVDDLLTADDIIDLGRAFRSFDPGTLDLYSLPVVPSAVGGASVLRLVDDRAQPTLDRFRGTDRAGPAPGRRPCAGAQQLQAAPARAAAAPEPGALRHRAADRPAAQELRHHRRRRGGDVHRAAAAPADRRRLGPGGAGRGAGAPAGRR